MRILVVGAGAIGGYFGGRLHEAGRDVSFLVRPQRARELAQSGLVIISPAGNATLRDVKTVLAESITPAFDLVLLSCKAYDLGSAILSFAPAVGPSTAILPLLNGMRHLDELDRKFGKSRVLGGQCVIAATLNKERAIVHLNDMHALSFGERDGGISERIQAIATAMQGAKFEVHASEKIVQEMWDKWVFLATLAGATCLFRGSIGDILAAPQGAERMLDLLEECHAVANASGYPLRTDVSERMRKTLTTASPLTASMLRDIEGNARIEADHIIGDLISRAAVQGKTPIDLPMLRIVYIHLKAYEARRERGLH
ncbi:MAG TPA: 2-dehydropantoate 2-reductase [Casimicrobiaceae bacterium]|jgi:2-dehydropantoate 2-reductase|nr:2-dehydropantoate 2-reductase [Casimicrobiaceae bacterium]